MERGACFLVLLLAVGGKGLIFFLSGSSAEVGKGKGKSKHVAHRGGVIHACPTRPPIRSSSRHCSFSAHVVFDHFRYSVVYTGCRRGPAPTFVPRPLRVFFSIYATVWDLSPPPPRPCPSLYLVLQGYVHIRTDGNSMVVPIELHVSRGGVDPRPSVVDFGVLTSPLERRQASVSLFNG